ncbi:MAG: hypothetical protein WAO35_21345 [Terriglobia bacterium]
MSLRKSPTLTPALVASNRRNAQKSTGPRTARGKAWSRLNRFRDGKRSPQYINFYKALYNAPLGEVASTVRRLLSPMPVVPGPFIDLASSAAQADIEICKEWVLTRSQRK